MVRSRNVTFLYSLPALLAALLNAAPAFAQVAGRLSGRVVDSSNATISGAKVRVLMPGGKTPLLTGTTNEAGLFDFIAVQPDRYEVAVEAKGFAKRLIGDVKVDPVEETSLGSIKLDIESASQSVVVTTEVPSVQLTGADIASTITNQQVENLPVLDRQVYNLFATQAGVNATNDTTSINGLRSSFSTVTIDGVNVQDNFIRTNDLDYPPMRTTIDQIAEITVATSNSGATIGGGSSQVVMVTKSGSNNYHGAIYWFNRNSALGANDWFNNQAGVNRPQLDLNQAGAALGGRIIRDKLFFYGNYETYRNKQQATELDTTLTDTAKQGIFSYSAGGVVRQVNLLNLRSFTIDPSIKALLSSLPEPNANDTGDGLNTSGYRFNAANNENRDQVVYKMDYYLTQRQNFSGTYNFIRDPTFRPDLGSFFTANPPVSNAITNHLMSLAWRWTLTPTLTNEVRGGFVLAGGNFVDNNKYPSYQLSGLLFTDPVNTFMNQGRQTNTYSIQDNANWVRGKHLIQFGYQSQLVRTAPFNDAGILPSYTLGLGSRTTSLGSADLPGASSANLSTANSLYANLAGYVSGASQTFNVTSPASGYVPGATNLRHLEFDTFAGYVHDNWKVFPNATVTLGLRYEFWTPVSERDSLFLTPNLENGNIIQTLLDPNAVLNFAGGPNTPLYKTDKNNLAPNVGLAWDPTGHGKTSIRAGYMVAFVNDSLVKTVLNNATTAAGLSSAASPGNLSASLASPYQIPTPVYKIPRTLLDNYLLNYSAVVGRPDPNLVTPYVQQWTVGIQHDFKGLIMEARYVGNHGTKLIRAFDYNQVLYNQGGLLADFKRAQSNLALSDNKSAAYNATIPGSQPLTLLPTLPAPLTSATLIADLQQGQVGQLASYEQSNYGLGVPGSSPISFFNNPLVLGANTVANGGDSNYHGLQLELRKRTRAGLQFQFSYTFSKALSNTTGDSQNGLEPFLDMNNPSLEKARSPFDITHAFKANYYYELPYGAGKRFHGNGFMNAVAGGWAISGIFSLNSGEPYSVISGLGTLNRSARSTTTNTANVGVTTLSALNALTHGVFMTGDGPYFISPSVINADGRGAEYGSTFSGEVFSNPGAGTVGDLQRRLFTGPWQPSWDGSLKKSFKLPERGTLDLRFDFFNLLNHPTFYIPPSTSGDYGSTTSVNVNNASFGQLTSMNYAPRVIQIGAYLRF